MAEPFFSARAPWRTPRFQPIRKAEQPCRPSPRASSRFPSVPPCPSLKTCTLGSVSFHMLGLSLFSSSCPSLRFRPVRHGEHLVFSPDARPNSHAARRHTPPCRFASVPTCPSLKPYIHLSFVVFPFHTLGLSLFSGSCPNLGFRPVRHGRTPRFQPKRKDEQPCRPSPRASVPEPPFVACLRVVFPKPSVPFTKDIHFMFGVFPHAWT